MALSPLAEVSDLAVWVEQEIPVGDLRAVAVLTAASNLVRAEARQTWDTALPPDEVVDVVVQAAARVWLNPSGATSWTKGPFSERYPEAAALGMYLTPAEQATLGRYRTSPGVPGLGTIRTTRGDAWYRQTLYVPTGPPPSGYDFPWYDADEPLL